MHNIIFCYIDIWFLFLYSSSFILGWNFPQNIQIRLSRNGVLYFTLLFFQVLLLLSLTLFYCLEDMGIGMGRTGFDSTQAKPSRCGFVSPEFCHWRLFIFDSGRDGILSLKANMQFGLRWQLPLQNFVLHASWVCSWIRKLYLLYSCLCSFLDHWSNPWRSSGSYTWNTAMQVVTGTPSYTHYSVNWYDWLGCCVHFIIRLLIHMWHWVFWGIPVPMVSVHTSLYSMMTHFGSLPWSNP